MIALEQLHLLILAGYFISIVKMFKTPKTRVWENHENIKIVLVEHIVTVFASYVAYAVLSAAAGVVFVHLLTLV